MKSSRITLSILLLGCVGLAAGSVVGQPAPVDATAQLELHGPETVTPGETVTVRVEVTTTRPLYAAQFGLSANGTALAPTAVDNGTFLARGARSIVIADELGARNVSYGETRVGADTGVNGTGTLATVTLSVAEDATNGTLGVELHGVKLVTPAAEPVDTSARNLTVTVVGSGGGSDDGGNDGGGGGGGGGQPGGGAGGEVEVTDVSLLNATATTDAAVVTQVDLANFDPAAGRITLTLTANGTVVNERTVAVAASSERTLFFEHRFGEPGRYTLMVNGSPVGRVTITAADTPAPTATRTSTPTATRTSTPTATLTLTATETDTPSGTTVPTDPSTTTGDGTGFGIASTAVALWLVVIRYARD